MHDSPAAPAVLGHYRIVSPLGAGGMGEVYLAMDMRLSRNVAIKVLPASSTADAEAQQRMRREARLIATIDHPNVCTIYEIGEEADQRYIVMQYVQGKTLGQRMRRGRLSLAEAIDVARQITAALSEAHRHGIVHRDIKPGNIMISSSGVVKVLDFGLAKSFLRAPDDATEVVISRPDIVSGTTPYMSPEQLLGEPLDGRSDIFSLGTVLYEIASGRRPFDRRTVAATINAILMAEPEPLGDDDLVALEPLILRALAKPVGRRFADASAMHEALTALGVTSRRRTTTARSATSRAPRRSRTGAAFFSAPSATAAASAAIASARERSCTIWRNARASVTSPLTTSCSCTSAWASGSWRWSGSSGRSRIGPEGCGIRRWSRVSTASATSRRSANY
jgi:serine/threonine protein kinase